MRAGASDYVLKDQLARLVPAVERELREAATRAGAPRAPRRRCGPPTSARGSSAAPPTTSSGTGAWAATSSGSATRCAAAGAGTSRWSTHRLAPRAPPPRRRRAGARRPVRGHRRGRGAWWDEYRFRRADGTYAPVLDRGYLMRDAGGQAYRMIGSMVDVSERRHMEETLRASEERFRTLVTLARRRSSSRSTAASASTASSAGRWRAWAGAPTSSSAPGVSELFGLEADVPLDAACRQALAGEHAVVEVSPATAAQQLLVSLSPMRDAAGHVTGVVGLSRDVTEHKRVQEQLLLSDRMVSVGTLAAGVAHEINNPLAAVVVNLDYIAKQVGDVRGADIAAAGTRRSRSAISRSLDPRRARSPSRCGKPASAIDRVRADRARPQGLLAVRAEPRRSSGPSTSSACSTRRCGWRGTRSATARGWSSGTAASRRSPGNESRLGQVFLNLIVNAAQAIREGQVERNEITLGTTASRAAGSSSRSPTPAAACPPEVLRKHLRRRSSPPSRSAPAPGSGCRSATASSPARRPDRRREPGRPGHDVPRRAARRRPGARRDAGAAGGPRRAPRAHGAAASSSSTTSRCVGDALVRTLLARPRRRRSWRAAAEALARSPAASAST